MERMHPSVNPVIGRALSVVAIGVAGAALATGVQAQSMPGPVVCTTSIEAPPAASPGSGRFGSAPVEVTRCSPVQSTAQLVDRRFYSYTAPFARGVSLLGQVTDLLGIAMGGGDGTKVMGLGFPDQTIVWDGSAIENLYGRMLDAQNPALPMRSPDLANPYRTSILMSAFAPRPLDAMPEAPGTTAAPSPGSTVRGLW